jgi:hypothetical protein
LAVAYRFGGLPEGTRDRYILFWADRFGQKNNGYYHLFAWGERIVVRSTTAVIEFRDELESWGSDEWGIPFEHSEIGFDPDAHGKIQRYDEFYMSRKPWREWPIKTAERLAKRLWNAEIRNGL